MRKRFLKVFLLCVLGCQSLSILAQGKKVTMTVKQMSLPAALNQVERLSNYYLINYDSKQLSKYYVNVNIKDKSALDAVKALLKGLPYNVTENGRYLIIKAGAPRQETIEPTSSSIVTEKKEITGRVVDSDGEPMIGVSVKLIDGGKMATLTDENGLFQLPINASKCKLKISYIGKKDMEVAAVAGKPIKIVMSDNYKAIDEVVVTGYQVINKRALTSSVTSLKAEDIMRPDVSSIDQMLEGKVPDMMFMSNSGEVGTTPKIRIRGTSSIIGNREPLWVIDGIVVSDPVQISPEELNDPDYVNRIGNAIAGLNPQDIERLDILKDASATALYGTKAANGVIVITTKRGREGKPQIRYDNTLNFKFRPRYTDHSINVMNSKERIQFSKELIANDYEYSENIPLVGYEGLLNQLYTHQITRDEFNAGVSNMETMNTDWFKLLCHDSFSQQHTVSFNGGSEKGRYYASLGFNDQDDVIKTNANKRYTAMINIDTNLTKWLTASYSLKGNVTKRKYYQSSVNPVEYAYTTSRAIPAYTAEGEYYYYGIPKTVSSSFNYNILNELANSGVTQEGNALTLDANFKFRFNSWLTANAIGSYNVQTTDIDSYWGEQTFQAASWRGSNYGVEAPTSSSLPQGGQLEQTHTRLNSYTIRLQLDMNKYFGADEIHNLNGSIGYEMSSSRYKGSDYTTRGYYPDRGKSFSSNIDLTKYTTYAKWLSGNVPTITDNLTNMVSAYASLTYIYNSMVYLNANARIDGSNKFGDRSNDKLLPIWSTSASFNFASLDFIKRQKWIDYLTVKTSYGFQGNMLSSESPELIITKKPLNTYFGELESTTNGRFPNPNLKWERTNSYNLGLEAGFFDRRLQFEASLYFKRTKDAFMTKTISTVNGTGSTIVNGGNISNDGYSFSLTAVPIRNKDWVWTLGTSFSRTINKIETNPDGEAYDLDNFLNGTAVVKGKATGTFYSYKFIGLNPEDGAPMFDDWENHYQDLQGLSKYDTYTRVLVASGTREPYMSGSLNTTVRYKNLRMNASFVYSLGAKTRLFGMYSSEAVNDDGDYTLSSASQITPVANVSRDYLKRWQKPGDEKYTNIPAIITPSNSKNYYKYISHWSNDLDGSYQTIANSYWDMYDYSDARVVSANYLKCSNISVTYELPLNWIRHLAMSRLEVSLAASNLFTICDSKLRGQTPTQGGFTNIQLSDRPSISLGLSATF